MPHPTPEEVKGLTGAAAASAPGPPQLAARARASSPACSTAISSPASGSQKIVMVAAFIVLA